MVLPDARDIPLAAPSAPPPPAEGLGSEASTPRFPDGRGIQV